MLNIKSRLVQIAGPLGGFYCSKILTRSTPKILMYHRFSEKPRSGFVHRKAFEQQLEYLQNNFNLITLEGLVKEYKQQGSFPVNSVVITVDDGYRDFYEIAFPVLKKYNAPATFFVTTRFIDDDFWLWPDRVRYILKQSDKIDLQEMAGGLAHEQTLLTDDNRQHFLNVIAAYLLSIAESEKECWLMRFAERQGVELPVQPIEDCRATNWHQLKEMDVNNIEIGAHTQSHPSLGRLEEEFLLTEIQGAVDIIQQQIGKRPLSFCFPNGQPSDYTELVKQHVKAAKCQSAVTAFYDKDVTSDLFELRRFSAGDDWQHFIRTVNGVDALSAKWFGSNNIMAVSR